MIKLYEDINKRYTSCMTIIAVVTLIVTAIIIRFVAPGIVLALALTIILAALVASILYIIKVFEDQATARYKKRINELSSNYNLKGLSKELKTLSERNIDDRLKSFMKVSLLGVYLNQGNLKAAKKIVEEFEPTYYTKEAGELVKITYLNNLTQYYIDSKELDDAKKYAKELKKTISSAEFINKYDKKRFNTSYKFKMSYMDIVEDNEEAYDKIKEDCIKMLNENTNVLEKISYNYILSMIYKKQKNNKEYKKCIEEIKVKGKQISYEK